MYFLYLLSFVVGTFTLSTNLLAQPLLIRSCTEKVDRYKTPDSKKLKRVEVYADGKSIDVAIYSTEPDGTESRAYYEFPEGLVGKLEYKMLVGLKKDTEITYDSQQASVGLEINNNKPDEVIVVFKNCKVMF